MTISTSTTALPSISSDFQTSSPSRVKFLQGALTYIHGLPLGIDGAYGPQTKQAVAAAFNTLGMVGDMESILIEDGREGIRRCRPRPCRAHSGEKPAGNAA